MRRRQVYILCLAIVATIPGSLAFAQNAAFDKWVGRAWDAFHADRFPQAESAFLEASKCATLRDGDYWGLSVAQRLQGKLTEAAQTASDGYKHYPDRATCVIRLCEALYETCDYRQAREIARVLLALPGYSPADPAAGSAVDRLCTKEFRITYHLDRRWLNDYARSVLGSRPLRCLIPTDTPYQRTTGVEVTGAAKQTTGAFPGGGNAFVDVDPADGQSCTVVVTVVKAPYLFRDLSGPTPPDAQSVPLEIRPFLARTQNVDPQLPQAVAAGAEVRRPEWKATVLAAQDWWNKNLTHFDTIKNPEALVLPTVPYDLVYSEKVLIQKVSRCGGLACAMAAVLRAAGIPSRVTGGAPGLSDDGPVGFHTWVECWHPASGWVPFDASIPLGPAWPYYRLASEGVVSIPAEAQDFYGLWIPHHLAGTEPSPIRSQLVRKWLED